MHNWQSTFEAYPDAEELFVAGGMPFLTRAEAAAHLKVAREGEVTKVTRSEAFAAAGGESGEGGEGGTTAGAGESGEGGEGGTTAGAGESGEGGENGTQPPSEPVAKKSGKPNKK